jgi:methyltransferase (TIGR00027 family)
MFNKTSVLVKYKPAITVMRHFQNSDTFGNFVKNTENAVIDRWIMARQHFVDIHSSSNISFETHPQFLNFIALNFIELHIVFGIEQPNNTITMNYKYITAIIISMCVLRLKSSKDSTAQSVAKMRHCESILEDPSERLYEDPYAHRMYFGSSVQTWLGGNITRKISDWLFMGMFDLLSLRTKWIDDEINKNGGTSGAEQLVILGAGYDTRGFRLDLPDGFLVVEVDQPGVQSKKRKILEGIAETDETVASRLRPKPPNSNDSSPHVEFLEIDFNKDTIGETLLSSSSLESTKKTIVTLEGVTQYIPRTSTASTLKQVHNILPEGSVLLISYVPQALFDNPAECGINDPRKLSYLLKAVEWFGEPWISSWSPESFASFLNECGYEVVSDVSAPELNEKYLVPRHRGQERDELPSLERYVVASVVK